MRTVEDMGRTRQILVTLLLVALTALGCSNGEPSAPEADQGAATPQASRSDQLRGPKAVAAQIRAAERTIADPSSSSEELVAAGRRQQVAYRLLGRRPAWDDRVRVLLPGWMRPTVRDNVASRRAFRSMHSELSRTLPAWRIVRPEPPRTLLRHYRAAERRFGVGWEYLAAINLVETGMGRIRGTSVAGAQGPMQFMPATWDAYGRGDVNDPRDAIFGAARYLDAMGFRPGRPAAVAEALYRYNNHPAYVRGVRLLAETMERRPRLYLGYHAWEVYYLTARGDILLPVGYDEDEPVRVRDYLRR